MIDTTQVLLNQVDNLETMNGMVRKDDVVSLIYGLENDLYDMSDREAMEQTQSILQHNLMETEEVMWELEGMDMEDDPFVRVYEEMLQGYFLDIAENYHNDLATAVDLLQFEIEDIDFESEDPIIA